MSAGVWVGLLFVVACSDSHPAAPDGPTSGDGGESDAQGVSACASTRTFAAKEVSNIASDGTNVYVVFQADSTTPQQLGMLMEDQDAPSVIATAPFVLTTFGDAVFYAASTGASDELHERVAGVDRVIGTVTSSASIAIAGNDTDLYVLAGDGVVTTLWRYPRAGDATAVPAVVATVTGIPAGITLGSTFALVTTSLGHWTVPVPGPSTATAITNGFGELAMVGDLGFSIHAGMVSSHAGTYSIYRELPSSMLVIEGGLIINGGLFDLRADTNHLYYVASSGSEGPPMTSTRGLATSSLDGATITAQCAGWPNMLAQDATHLYAAERAGDDRWVVDVAPKP